MTPFSQFHQNPVPFQGRNITNVGTVDGRDLSADGAVLDDLEPQTGAFTPGIAFGGGATGITYSAQTGTYIKISNVYMAFAFVALTAKGTSTGQATLTGLPATPASVGGASVGYFANFTGLAGTPLLLVDSNAGGPRFYVPGAASAAGLTDTSFTNTSQIRLSFIFTV